MSEPKGRTYTGTVVVTELRRELDRLFQEILAASESIGRGGWTPATDLLELPDRFVVLVEVPGLVADQVTVTVEGSRMTIEGTRRLHFPHAERVRFHCLERREGRFRRHIEVFQPVDFSEASATLRRGLLAIELPKLEERRRRVRTIPVTTETEEGVE